MLYRKKKTGEKISTLTHPSLSFDGHVSKKLCDPCHNDAMKLSNEDILLILNAKKTKS